MIADEVLLRLEIDPSVRSGSASEAPTTKRETMS